ncbi:hypothetical protein CW667_02100 [Candidatus Bathyarchaeota archaeon]|nr:MAG: hypothetical protein CW667_02100 [Candidatus Bathyarchaeota archaeon]RLI17301.1 MAG: hypothetical protein DRO44_03850 [Candidatus Bathyarchaeota archaeon]
MSAYKTNAVVSTLVSLKALSFKNATTKTRGGITENYRGAIHFNKENSVKKVFVGELDIDYFERSAWQYAVLS